MGLIFTSWWALTASALLTVGLGFPIGSGQNTAGLALSVVSPSNSRPGLWVSSALFRQRGWRMMGSSWGIRVFLLSPRGGIAGIFLLILFLMVPAVLLLPWALSGRCPELPLYGGLACGFYLMVEASSAALGSVLHTLCAQSPFHPLLNIRGAPMPSCSWRSSPPLWGGLWYLGNIFFSPSCCLLLKHTNPVIPP